MNKAIINEEITYAYEALTECKIAAQGKIDKTYRGQISSFGAAITMGSLLPAIAFFADNGGSSVDREKLMKAILFILKKRTPEIKETSLYDYVANRKKDELQCKEDILNAAIALKLAMNLYHLEKKE